MSTYNMNNRNSIARRLAVFGCSVGLLSATLGGLVFIMNVLGLNRNPETQFDHATLITGLIALFGLVVMGSIIKIVQQ